LEEDERRRLCCFAMFAEGKLLLNFVAVVIFVNKLPGVLAKRMQIRSSLLDAFTDIGSVHAKAFLEAKLSRAGIDPVAADLRAEVDGPSNIPLAEVSTLSFSIAMANLETRLNESLQKTMLEALRVALPPALSLAQLAPEAVQVNLNTSRRSNADLRRINLPPPSSDEDSHVLARNTLTVSVYLLEKLTNEPGVYPRVARHVLQKYRGPFSAYAKKRKQELGSVTFVGQLGRSQVHYTHSDRHFLDECWANTTQTRSRILEEVISEFREVSQHLPVRAAPYAAPSRPAPILEALRRGGGAVGSTSSSSGA
jgi:hypothetical protein